ncbi:toll/interleukin-1 receptor domain-containing protein [Dongia sp.]|uniref:toll/interleukin-1 receptor domain-containing protein n=1 Tax=Dongia sp. TaxID=1977262 RepID=UPI0035B312C7
MSQSTAFLSYHHDDRIIGETVLAQLAFLASRGEGKPALKCFLDARDIPRGQAWKPIIDENLANKDWLIPVFTGDQSVYCGYEIGTFLQLHVQSPDKRVMALYDVDDEKLPIILRDGQNTQVPPVDNVVEADKVAVSTDEVNFWFRSAVGRFLQDFCLYKGLYTPAHESSEPAAYSNNIALCAKLIANAFALARGTDEKSETPAQIGFELTIRKIGDQRLDKIPGDSVVIGTTLFFDLLGLSLPVSRTQAPMTTWETLRQLLNPGGQKVIPWMHKVEADIRTAAASLSLPSDDVTMRGRNGKVYRPILERHKLFVNGDRRFYLLFIEALDRRFVGVPQSSLLLTSLILASRWRFTYFEKWSDTITKVFGPEVPLPNFADACKQLLYNIEWIEHEAAQFGATDPQALIDAFGSEHKARVERFFSDWQKAKEALQASLELGTEITDFTRDGIHRAVLDFLTATRGQNAEFLQLAIKEYADEIGQGLESRDG